MPEVGYDRDDSVEAEFRGSLTICEDGQIRATTNPLTGAVVDKFGVYRAAEDDRDPNEWRWA